MKLVIFGCGNIAKRIAASCLKVDTIDLLGFASKDLVKAKEYADLFGCKEYGDYDSFLNKEADAVYIAVYNPGHYELIRRCIDAHKNVICEKPMLFSLKEYQEVFAYAEKKNVLLMEALKSVFLPSIQEVKRMIKEGQIGEIQSLEACFMRNGNHQDSHWINDLRCGGAFKDLGSYCVGTLNYLMDCEAKLLHLESDRNAYRAETTAFGKLDYNGVSAKVCVSNSKDGNNDLIVQGSRGRIVVHNFWKQGKIVYEIDDKAYEKDVPLVSDFYYELKHFSELCDTHAKESGIMSKQASQRIIKITEKVDKRQKENL